MSIDSSWLEAMESLSSPETKAKVAKEDKAHADNQEANRRIGREATFEGKHASAKLMAFQRKDNWLQILNSVSPQSVLPASSHWDAFMIWLESNADTFCKRKPWDFYDRSWWREAVLEGYLKAMSEGTTKAYEENNGQD